MAELRLHGQPVGTVFDLLGKREDEITYSVGWALAQSDALARALLREAFDEDDKSRKYSSRRRSPALAGPTSRSRRAAIT
jgi:hypothetical protein